MPNVTINGSPVTAGDGCTIFEAARSAHIAIPTLCWYPKLPIVGNCRICLVSVAGCGLKTEFDSPESVMDEVSRVAPSWTGVSYDRLSGGGLQYPVPNRDHPGTSYLFAESFPTKDGRASFQPAQYSDPDELPDDEFPFIMNTGRQLYHWHTGTMTRRSQGLDAIEPIATMEIHPDDAVALGLADGDLAKLTSRRNSIIISVRISDRVARKQVFVPFHYREAAANLLTSPVLEPHAKMPELKISAVKIESVPAS
ncbi:MAG: (2Fe-2S)-binding protein [Gemmatimonadetes bacterium]|nr:(2Fe-2S)-binding protein [Gemmatimonadota bacterium]